MTTTYGYNPNINYNFNVNFNFYGNQVHCGYNQSLQAAQLLQGIMAGGCYQPPPPVPQLPMCGCMPTPRIDMCGVPAGKGLSTDCPPEGGFPEGTITTAGGYKIVPTGSQAAWEVYGPDQQYCDKPLFKTWGDPHVDEKDGTRWDFTKDSDFVLPDGTRIHCDTTAQTGRSVSQNLTIWNGNDRVEVTGINSNDPQVSQVYHDGYRTRAEHLATNRDMHSFYLTGDNAEQTFVRVTNGEAEGAVTGAYYDSAKQQYIQKLDENNIPRPAVGSEGWGNAFRNTMLDHRVDQIMDLAENFFGPEVAQWLGGHYAQQYAGAMEMNHWQNQHFGHFFGGWNNIFPSFDHGAHAVRGMHDLLMHNHLFQNHTDHLRYIDRGVLC